MADNTPAATNPSDNAQAPGQTVPEGEAQAAGKLTRAIKRRTKDYSAAHQAYARDREYAANRVGPNVEVAVPIAQSYVDVLRSFLFAKSPDVSCDPSPATEPPPERAIQAMARKQVRAEAEQNAQQSGMPPDPNVMQSAIQNAVTEILQPFLDARDNAEQFAETVQIVVSQVWKRAGLKAQALLQVNSALTIGIGWLKVVWLDRTARDPIVDKQIADLQDNLADVQRQKQDMADNPGADLEGKQQELQVKIEGLNANVEKIVERGLVIEFLAGEDVIVGPCRGMWDYKNAPWICTNYYWHVNDVLAKWPQLKDRIDAATSYSLKKPKSAESSTATIPGAASVDPASASNYQKAGGEDGEGVDKNDRYVLVREVYQRADNQIVTLIDGMTGYACKPHPPKYATSRFFPHFAVMIGLIDGEQHPRSLITRSTKLFDEYNAVRSNLREHRRRTLPKTVFDRTNITPEDAKRIEGGGLQEMVGIAPIRKGEPVGNALQPLAYAQIDPRLYDTSPIRADLELVWGIQEALSSSIHTPKTATEAEIQNAGTESRTGYMRDAVDDSFSDMAQYTAELCLGAMDEKDVKDIAGEWAFWPKDIGPADLDSLIKVSISAGSSGKPNTAAEQQVWSQMLPMLQQAIKEVGQLRNSSPDEVADAIEQLVRESFKRMGERVDVTTLLPQAADPSTAPPPDKPAPPIAEASLMGPQVVALTTVLDQVRQGILSKQTAEPLIKAAFPTLDESLVTGMVNGVAPGTPASNETPPPGGAPTGQPQVQAA